MKRHSCKPLVLHRCIFEAWHFVHRSQSLDNPRLIAIFGPSTLRRRRIEVKSCLYLHKRATDFLKGCCKAESEVITTEIHAHCTKYKALSSKIRDFQKVLSSFVEIEATFDFNPSPP